MKISSFIVSMVVVGIFASLFAAWFSGLGDAYNNDFNQTSFDSYDKVQEVQENIQSIKTGIEADETDQGLTDLVGGFLKKGFAVIQLTFQSLGLFETMASDATNQIEEQTAVEISWISFSLVTIVVIIFVFLIISVLVGRDI